MGGMGGGRPPPQQQMEDGMAGFNRGGPGGGSGRNFGRKFVIP